MLQIRFHGRGGQGVVTMAELLSVAAFLEGRCAQAFPSFGSERMGAPVAAFCRVADGQIRTREPVVSPDAVVVADTTLVHQVDVLSGAGPTTLLVINSGSQERAVAVPAPAPGKVLAVPATGLALAHLGRPVPGAPLLGALAAASGVVGLESLRDALRQRFGGRVGEGNVAAAEEGYRLVLAKGEGAGPAVAAPPAGTVVEESGARPD